MARIADAELARLKAEVSVERLAVARGIELKKRGAELMGLCPFHEDHSPSLTINPALNVWKCHGACQAGGSVIDWVMRAEGVSFRHAVELLRADLPDVGTAAVVKVGTVRKLPSPVSLDADDAALLSQVVDYYHSTLLQSPEALAYLERRGLKSPELCERYRLGYANRTLGLRLPAKNRQEGAALRGRLEKLGVLRQSTGHEHLRGSIVIPILDEAGQVQNLYGRKIAPVQPEGTPAHLYLPGPHRGVFNEAALGELKTVILCEALIDALSFVQRGYPNVTSAYGVEGFTEEILACFHRKGIERVLIAYDRDEAGERAAQALAPKLMAEGFECYRVQFPQGTDANEHLVKESQQSFDQVLKRAEWLGKGASALQREATKRAQAWAAEQQVKQSETKAAAVVEPTLFPLAAASALAPPPPVAEPRSTEAPSEVASPAAAPEPRSMAPAHPSAEAPIVAQRAAPAAPESLAAALAELEKAPTTAGISAPLPATSPKEPEPAALEGKEDEIVLQLGERRYRVRGLAKNTSFDALKVNLLVSKGETFHVDTLDLYSAKQRAAFVAQALTELRVDADLLKHDLGQVLLKLEGLHEESVRKLLEPKQKEVALSEEQRAAALELLRDPKLLDRLLTDFARCGVVGEETNKLVGYLAAVSRKLEEPLAVIIQSSSAAGKSSLMDAVLAFVPEEERVQYSAMTGQSLFYMGETDLKHKILAIVEEEGASRAAYALKLLQSEGELTIASTGKDPQTGKLVTHAYRVEGPTQLFMTTTASELDEELRNRCVVLAVDEEREQTRAIHQLQRQRQTLQGLLARRDRQEILQVHRNAQRLLRPLVVSNDFAPQLTFLDDRTRTRRDHAKYLTLIRTIALLHQYQREVKTIEHHGKAVQYIEVTLADVEIANQLAHQVLGRSLDELPPQTRRLLMLLDGFVTERCTKDARPRQSFRFTRREVREASGWGNSQLKVHLDRLQELEYVIAHRTGAQGFVYELAYDGQGKDGTPFLSGLIDPAQLRSGAAAHEYDAGFAGSEASFAGRLRPVCGPFPGGSRVSESDDSSSEAASLGSPEANRAGKALLGASPETASYVEVEGAAAPRARARAS